MTVIKKHKLFIFLFTAQVSEMYRDWATVTKYQNNFLHK